MPYQITATRRFSASHQLRLADGSLEPLHGHNWRVKVSVSSAKLDSIGTVMDFHELAALVDQFIEPMHNKHLNDLLPFNSNNPPHNPSAECVAREIARSLKLPAGVQLAAVEVWETDDFSAIYQPT